MRIKILTLIPLVTVAISQVNSVHSLTEVELNFQLDHCMTGGGCNAFEEPQKSICKAGGSTGCVVVCEKAGLKNCDDYKQGGRY